MRPGPTVPTPTRTGPPGGRPPASTRPKGSLARTPACLKVAGHLDQRSPDPARYITGARRTREVRPLPAHRGASTPGPHESWYQNSGYFCYYGYYYAALLTADVPEKRRAAYRKQLAGHMLDMQERDGSWWDYQLYGYHKAYGTGYALCILAACRP